MVPVEHVEEQVNIIELDTNAIVLAAFFKLKSRELSRAILIQDLEESPKAEDPSSTTLIHLLPEFIQELVLHKLLVVLLGGLWLFNDLREGWLSSSILLLKPLHLLIIVPTSHIGTKRRRPVHWGFHSPEWCIPRDSASIVEMAMKILNVAVMGRKALTSTTTSSVDMLLRRAL